MEIFIDALRPKEFILKVLEEERSKIRLLINPHMFRVQSRRINKYVRSLINYISLIEELIVVEIADRLRAKYEDAIVVNTVLIPFYIEAFKIKVIDLEDDCLIKLSRIYCPPSTHIPPNRYWKIDPFYTKFKMVG